MKEHSCNAQECTEADTHGAGGSGELGSKAGPAVYIWRPSASRLSGLSFLPETWRVGQNNLPEPLQLECTGPLGSPWQPLSRSELSEPTRGASFQGPEVRARTNEVLAMAISTKELFARKADIIWLFIGVTNTCFNKTRTLSHLMKTIPIAVRDGTFPPMAVLPGIGIGHSSWAYPTLLAIPHLVWFSLPGLLSSCCSLHSMGAASDSVCCHRNWLSYRYTSATDLPTCCSF